MELLELLRNIIVSNVKFIVLLLICVIVDTILGMIKARKNHNLKYTSSGFKKVYIKLIVYSALLLLFVFFDWAFYIKHYVSTKILCLILCSNEIVSIRENTQEIPGITLFFDNILEIVNKLIKKKE